MSGTLYPTNKYFPGICVIINLSNLVCSSYYHLAILTIDCDKNGILEAFIS